MKLLSQSHTRYKVFCAHKLLATMQYCVWNMNNFKKIILRINHWSRWMKKIEKYFTKHLMDIYSDINLRVTDCDRQTCIQCASVQRLSVLNDWSVPWVYSLPCWVRCSRFSVLWLCPRAWRYVPVSSSDTWTRPLDSSVFSSPVWFSLGTPCWSVTWAATKTSHWVRSAVPLWWCDSVSCWRSYSTASARSTFVPTALRTGIRRSCYRCWSTVYPFEWHCWNRCCAWSWANQRTAARTTPVPRSRTLRTATAWACLCAPGPFVGPGRTAPARASSAWACSGRATSTAETKTLASWPNSSYCTRSSPVSSVSSGSSLRCRCSPLWWSPVPRKTLRPASCCWTSCLPFSYVPQRVCRRSNAIPFRLFILGHPRTVYGDGTRGPYTKR